MGSRRKKYLPLILQEGGLDDERPPRDSGLHGASHGRRTAPLIFAKSARSGTSNIRTQYWPADLDREYEFEDLIAFKCDMKRQRSDPAALEETLRVNSQILGFLWNPSDSSPSDFKRIAVRKRMSLQARCISGKKPQDHALDLSNLGGRFLTANIAFFSALTVLNVTGNQFRYLPKELGSLESLRVLDASRNLLADLPQSIGNLLRLERIILDNNSLVTLPRSTGLLQNLEYLSASNNRLNQLPRELGMLEKLATLELRFNLLEWLPAEIGLLRQLRIICLEGNPLIKEEFIRTKELELGLHSASPSPSLLETAARKALREQLLIGKQVTYSLSEYISRGQVCSFCHGPLIDSGVFRIRRQARQEVVIPFLYTLCRPHWDDERGRIRAMFTETPTNSASKLRKLQRAGSVSALLGQPLQCYGAQFRKVHRSKTPPKPEYISLSSSQLSGTIISLLSKTDKRCVMVDKNWAATVTDICE